MMRKTKPAGCPAGFVYSLVAHLAQYGPARWVVSPAAITASQGNEAIWRPQPTQVKASASPEEFYVGVFLVSPLWRNERTAGR